MSIGEREFRSCAAFTVPTDMLDAILQHDEHAFTYLIAWFNCSVYSPSRTVGNYVGSLELFYYF
jgi:hypothetical protein